MFRMRTLVQLVALIVVVLIIGPSAAASPMATSPILTAAASYSVLAGSIVTNGGPTTISGNVGISPSIGAPPHFTGFPPGIVGPPGTIHDADVNAGQAQADSTAAFGALSAVPNAACDVTYGPAQDLVGLTLAPGVYCFPSSAQLTTGVALTLDGGGNSAATWIFRMASTLDTTPGVGATVVVTNGGLPCNVWWQVGSSAAIGSGTTFVGNILALTSIGLGTGASLDGRALVQTGGVTLLSNNIFGPSCVLAAPSITTQIHDAIHAVVISPAPIGTIVHDMATVTGTIGIPTPTGIVSFTVYANPSCSGIGTFAGAVLLNGAGVADPSNPATLTSAGLSYIAQYGGDTNYPAAAGPCEVLAAIPTAVQLLYFQADPLIGQQVQLKWATALEVDNFGFNLYRANIDNLDVARAGLPIHFEPAVTQGSGSGATYVYMDTAPSAGPWWYWLSDVDTHGIETFHNAPININVQSNNNLPYHVYLPFIAKGSGN